MTSSLTELSKLISDSVASLTEVCKENGFKFPRLDDPFTPESEVFRSNAVASDVANVIAAAALQLAAAVLPPRQALFMLITGHSKSAALRVCVEANVTEILREAGPKGLHVNEIALKSNINGTHLARMMRYLATHHVYKELEPNVFINTRISCMLDTGISVEELSSNPATKYDGPQAGFAALAGHHLDIIHKSSAYLWETIQDPASGFSEEVTNSAFNRAFKQDLSIWSWFDRPEQTYRRRRFDAGMRGVASIQPAGAILDAFDWTSLAPGSVVVDVGGGVGTTSLALAQAHSHLNIIVQDLSSTIEKGLKFWTENLPSALDTGRVKFQVHDFFTEQPVKNASVFLLKQILHDWPNKYASKILVELRKAAQPHTKLILIDSIIPFACHDPSADEEVIPGAVPREAPSPLLANFGAVNEMGYNADISMFVLFNALERTIKNATELLQSTGWRVLQVHRRGSSNYLQPIEAIPSNAVQR